MTKLLRLGWLALLALNSVCESAGALDPPQVPAFSRMTAGAPPAGWQILKPAPHAAETHYSLVADAGVVVLAAAANHSMSGLIYPVRVDVREFPRLRWRWKITAPLQTADMMTKAGDDYAARIYVLFDYPVEKLSMLTRAKLKLAELAFGTKIPTAALNYIWDNRHPIGTVQANAYTDRARMIVVESGTANVGGWVTETRDLRADFRAAFNEEPPPIVAVALATDTDNTGEMTAAWYGDLEFLPGAPAPP